MTTRFKTTLAAGIAVLTLAGGAPLLMAAASAEATAARQDQQPQQRQGRGPGGPGGPGMRGPGGPGGPMGLGPGFRNLDLTDDQKAQLKKIAEARRSDFEAAGQKVRAAREGMRALIEADSINESAIRAKSVEIAAVEADVMILNAKVRQESLQVLTSEQQAKLKEQRSAREGQAKQRKPRGQ
ncbi:MAG: Spy/CpxP family protein refolding chaperone [Vicinamibacterales bacterium]